MAKDRDVTFKAFSLAKDFGFFGRDDGGDVFIRGNTLRKAGFDPARLLSGMKATVQIASVPKGHEATRVTSIEGLEPSMEPVASQEPVVVAAVTKTPFKPSARDRRTSAYHPKFFRSTTVDRDKELGSWRIVKVVSMETGDFQHYVLFQKKEGGGETSNTFPVLEAARAAIGKVIVPPMPEGYGKATNVVSICQDSSRKSKGEVSKGKPKRQAA